MHSSDEVFPSNHYIMYMSSSLYYIDNIIYLQNAKVYPTRNKTREKFIMKGNYVMYENLYGSIYVMWNVCDGFQMNEEILELRL